MTMRLIEGLKMSVIDDATRKVTSVVALSPEQTRIRALSRDGYEGFWNDASIHQLPRCEALIAAAA